ncbi:MAG: NERD domain-containing protein [Kiritimatiellae bacterium]|nr:NERD domain-containing protein [Kiritimatiellia bacterium]
MTPSSTTDLLPQILPILLLFGLLSVLMAAFKAFLLPTLKGRLGEASINFWVKRMLDQNVYHLIPDVTLPTPDGTTQIDHVIVSRYGIFVIETKTYKGWIYGSERDAKWTQVIYKRKERFQNPLRQNHKHTKTLSDLTGIPHEYFKSMVVFVGESKFKTDMPANVVHIREFIRHIKSYQTPIIRDGQVAEVAAVIQEWAGTVTDEQRRQHVKNLRRNRRGVETSAAAPACPRCGSAMVLRTSRKDGSQFWGCPGYPACRGTRKAA